jgi:hypothetical protein
MLPRVGRGEPFARLFGLGKRAKIQSAGPKGDAFNGDILIVVIFEKDPVVAIVRLLQCHPEVNRFDARCNIATNQANVRLVFRSESLHLISGRLTVLPPSSFAAYIAESALLNNWSSSGVSDQSRIPRHVCIAHLECGEGRTPVSPAVSLVLRGNTSSGAVLYSYPSHEIGHQAFFVPHLTERRQFQLLRNRVKHGAGTPSVRFSAGSSEGCA